MQKSHQVSSVVFFNNFNNGDVFYSKEYIRFFAQTLKIRAYHSHGKCPSIIGDLQIPYTKIDTDKLTQVPIHVENGTLFVNTWIGQENTKWLHRESCGYVGGCTLKNNHRMYTSHAAVLGLSLPDEQLFIPDIDWKYYGVEEFALSTERNVFISNGNVLSGQTVNWDMSPMILELAKKHPMCTFYVTHPFPTDLANVINANQFFVHEPPKSNLNQLSKLSTQCDIVVGRPSGPYCFTHIKQNLFDKNKSFIVSSNSREEGHWAVLDDYALDSRAKQTWVECHVCKRNNDCPVDLFDAIDDEIHTKYGSG